LQVQPKRGQQPTGKLAESPPRQKIAQ